MRQKLFGFFMVIIVLTVSITGAISYNFTKDISILYRIQSIIELTKKDLRGTSDA